MRHCDMQIWKAKLPRAVCKPLVRQRLLFWVLAACFGVLPCECRNHLMGAWGSRSHVCVCQIFQIAGLWSRSHPIHAKWDTQSWYEEMAPKTRLCHAPARWEFWANRTERQPSTRARYRCRSFPGFSLRRHPRYGSIPKPWSHGRCLKRRRVQPSALEALHGGLQDTHRKGGASPSSGRQGGLFMSSFALFSSAHEC